MRRIGIFCLFSPSGEIDPTMIYTIKSMHEIVGYLIIVVNGSIHSEDELRDYADEVVIRENTGFDIGAYKAIVLSPKYRNKIEEAEELVLCNSSFYGPFITFREIFQEMEDSDCDFWGISSSEKNLSQHIQSYFYVFRRRVLEGEELFRYLEEKVDVERIDYFDACSIFENGLFQTLKKAGYRFGAYKRCIDCDGYRNPYGSVKLDGLPLLKKKIFSKEFYQEKRVINALSYVKETYGFDIEPILSHACRAYGIGLTGEMVKRAVDASGTPPKKDLVCDPEAVGREEIERFIEKHPDVYIYGNGIMAKIVYSSFFFFEKNPRLKGFVVSDQQPIPEESFKGYPIYRYSEVKGRVDTAFLVAMDKRNTREVLTQLSKEKNVMFLWRCQMSGLVSIIMPVSGGEYFKESLESICNQTYRNLEIIIIDSSDSQSGIKEVISGLRDERIRYFYQEKRGVANALNLGIARAKGQYIARMDADDVAFLGRITRQVEYMEAHPEIDAAASSYILIDGRGGYIKEEVKSFSFEEMKYELLFDNPICHPTVIFRRSIFDDGWSYRDVFAEDYDMWTRLVVCKKLSVMPDVLLKYRVHTGNLSNANVLKVNDSDIRSALIYVKALLGIHVPDDKKWLLARTYHLSQVTADEVGDCKEFLLAQYEFLHEMKKKAGQLESFRKNILDKIILRRWRNIIDISNIISLPKELYEFPSGEKEGGIYKDNLKRVIEDNDMWVKKIQEEEVKFFLYGFGERGHRTLNRYLELHKSVLRSWKLLGIVDKEEKPYSVGGRICRTCGKKEITQQEYDYILVSAFEYYEEVRDELLELKISGKKILRDNIIFFFRTEDIWTGLNYQS